MVLFVIFGFWKRPIVFKEIGLGRHLAIPVILSKVLPTRYWNISFRHVVARNSDNFCRLVSTVTYLNAVILVVEMWVILGIIFVIWILCYSERQLIAVLMIPQDGKNQIHSMNGNKVLSHHHSNYMGRGTFPGATSRRLWWELNSAALTDLLYYMRT